MTSDDIPNELTCELSFDIDITDGILTIKPSRPFTRNELYDAFIEEALFWKDMEFYHSNTDGWLYIVSMNHQLVFPMNDYGYDLIHDLMTDKDISVMGRDNLPDYADYEWNEE